MLEMFACRRLLITFLVLTHVSLAAQGHCTNVSFQEGFHGWTYPGC